MTTKLLAGSAALILDIAAASRRAKKQAFIDMHNDDMDPPIDIDGMDDDEPDVQLDTLDFMQQMGERMDA